MIFEECKEANDLLNRGKDNEARKKLIRVLDQLEKEGDEYPPLVNHLLRSAGLYPYMRDDNISWQDEIAKYAFSANVGKQDPVILHYGQAQILDLLLKGEDVIVSAPTSFGKSYIIDAVIAQMRPRNVLIIVPTIALTDETRRRLNAKFSCFYNIITTPDAPVEDQNLFILTPERAHNYAEVVSEVDLLIVDEFYKAGIEYGQDRAPILQRVLYKLAPKARQRYYITPTVVIDANANPLTNDMQVLNLDFDTVYLDIHDCYEMVKYAQNRDAEKTRIMNEVLDAKQTKTLIYAGTFANIDTIANALLERYKNIDGVDERLKSFSEWIKINYDHNFVLADLAVRGIGIHNGRLHRALSQIQVRLFELRQGLSILISTSSIIEGVNTSAENVIVWSNKNGRPKINDFTYKNIIGRGGRMFKHFVGKVYLLDEHPAQDAQSVLSLEPTDDVIQSVGADDLNLLRDEDKSKVNEFASNIEDVFGAGSYINFKTSLSFSAVPPSKLIRLGQCIRDNLSKYRGLKTLNSDNVNDWNDAALYAVLRLKGSVGCDYSDFIRYLKAITNNWIMTIPDILSGLRSSGITIEKYFELEKQITFAFPSFLSDVVSIYNIFSNDKIEISAFVAKCNSAFLPKLVYEMEEYGLPRMISRKFQDANLVNFEDNDLTIRDITNQLLEISRHGVYKQIPNLTSFEKYIIAVFYEGISTAKIDGFE